jgi:lysophospholipase L1-like esterase
MIVTTETLNYVALGDSIAYGTGATNDYGYVYLHRDFLATNGTTDTADDDKTINLTNKAIRGIKTSDLLLQLNVDGGVKKAIRSANLVTASIGGNNLPACATDNYSYIDSSCANNGVSQF